MRPARLYGAVPVDKPGRRVWSPGRGLRGGRCGLRGPGAPGCRGWAGCAYVPKVQVRVWARWGCCGWSGCAYLPGVVVVLAERGFVAGLADEVAASGVGPGHGFFSFAKVSAYRARYLPGVHDFPLLMQRTPARRQRASRRGE